MGFGIQHNAGLHTDVAPSLIYALNVTEQSEMTLDLLLQLEQEAIFDVQSVDLGPRVIVVQAVVRPGGDWHVVAFDVHSRTRLLFPPFTYAMWGVDEDEDEDEDKVGVLFHALHSSNFDLHDTDGSSLQIDEYIDIDAPSSRLVL